MNFPNISPEQNMQDMCLPLRQQGRMAFVMSPRLGDALIAMTLIYNLFKKGYDITVYSDFMAALKQWFPWVQVFPYPDEAEAKASWNQYDVLLHRYPHDVRYDSRQWHPCVLSLSTLPFYRQCLNEVDLQLLTAKKIFNIEQPLRANGMTLPQGFVHRRYLSKVVIHPTASMKTRYWLPRYFIKLAARLMNKGYEPVFLVASHEDEETRWIETAGFNRMVTTSIENAAEVIGEAGWFIGNDSGLGHLASCLGIPTISMHQRRKVSICWHPGFAPNKALLPRVNLLIKPWKEKYWKYFLTPNQVYHAFLALVNAEGRQK
ncbi:MAG: hypothetical protein K0Q74_188 [Gammaproteobacteria bacterium]|jgi:ADP-heptose:LPS heptosyltransferase|nr:hypothetical protein [Gammaproteobacteria bacterium]